MVEKWSTIFQLRIENRFKKMKSIGISSLSFDFSIVYLF